MFTSLVLCIGSLILILLELTFPILSNEYDTKCYPVGNQRVCFFRPQFNYTWETWYKATAVCKRKNGTLPFMPDEVTQHAFEDYINSLMHRFSDDIWMAGREERKKEWTWSNGVKFNEPSYFTLTHSEYNSRHLQAILADDLVYKKEYLGNEHHYVCQFFGKSCQVNDSIPLKSGCVILNDGKALDFYDARNKCVEKGGDLPVIDGQDDLNKFRQVFTRTGKAAKAGLWLGLRRQWWIWNVTDRAEMKYCNWLLDNGFKPEGGCMVAEMTDYLWKQENCTEYKRFICQTGPANVEVLATPTSTNSPAQLAGGLLFFVAGLSIMALAILILVIVVVAVIVNKKRNARNRQAKMDVVPRETSYQHLEHRFHEKNNPKSDHQYMELQSEAKKRLMPTTARPLMSQRTEQGPEYIYDDIAEIRAPSYLDVVQ